MLNRIRFKMDGIQRHLRLLDILQERNDLWVTGTSRLEIRQAHERIIDLVNQIRKEYVAILELHRADIR